MLEPLPTLPSSRVIIGDTGEFLPPRKPGLEVEYKTRIIHIPREPKEMSNFATQCGPLTDEQEAQVKPEQCEQNEQTDADLEDVKTCVLPVPIYVPTPLRTFSLPRPVPKPFFVPIPVPIFIPLTKVTGANIMKELSKYKKNDVEPTDPYEADLLAMAEAVAGAEKSASDVQITATDVETYNYNNQNISQGFNEDLVQMALKMATNDYDMNSFAPDPYADNRSRKRQLAPAKENRYGSAGKRIKSEPMHIPPVVQQPEPQRPQEKPDANMCLKFTFGVNAWKQWVITKNAELEKSSYRRKPFKTEILQMTADELNYSLCLFVKEVRKPNGTEYAPDTIYYLVLGIQQYLYENGRIDNIFTDIYYEKFTDCLDEVARKFSVLYNDSRKYPYGL